MNKKEFEPEEFEIIRFEIEDVIVTSTDVEEVIHNPYGDLGGREK